jgi:CRISPR-associated protein Cmr4
MTTAILLGLLAETSLHPGAGQSADVVDLPVAREGATGLPHIPDTGLKGALLAWARDNGVSQTDRDYWFGTSDDGAGQLLISTARLLCLPVRRLDGPYAWVTTPYLLERLGRDVARGGAGVAVPSPLPDPTGSELLVDPVPTSPVYLEEFSFTATALTGGPEQAIKQLVTDQVLAVRLYKQLAIMSDEEFGWYAQNALPVTARNQLNENKMSKNLWYEETLPPDTLLYSLILPRNQKKATLDALNAFGDALAEAKYFQAGGNETVGQGWLRVAVVRKV